MSQLSENVDWHYVLREFWTMYRFSSAGGSRPIRSHQREVRNHISAAMAGDPEVVLQAPETLPVCDWLGRAIDQGLLERSAPLVRAIRRVTDHLRWRYGYERVPRGLKKKCAHSELMGPTGDHEPTLLAYAWTGPKDKLLSQKMKFSRPRRSSQ